MSSPTPQPSEQNPLARPVGYAVVLAALVGLFLAGAFVVREWMRPHRILRIHFPEIATLSEGDPVVQGGVPIGEVVSIRLPTPSEDGPGREAVVTIELDNLRPLTADTRFVNFSHSLMGARKVWVVPGRSTEVLDESRIQEGVFQPGLAETLHRVDSLVTLIARVRLETERLLVEDNPLKSPMAAARAVDSAAVKIEAITARLESARAALEAGITGFTSAAQSARHGVRAAEPPISHAMSQARQMIRAVESVETNLDSLMRRVERVSALATDTTGPGRVLTSRKAYDDLEKSVRLLEAAAHLLSTDGLTDSMKIKPRVMRR